MPGSTEVVLLSVVPAGDVALLGGRQSVMSFHDDFFSVVGFYEHGFVREILPRRVGLGKAFGSGPLLRPQIHKPEEPD